MTEQALMKQIQAALSLQGLKCFRANVGMGWTGKRIRNGPRGEVILEDARPFSTGLPKGFPDLMAFCPGGHVRLLEVKTPRGRVSGDQAHFAEIMRPLGFEVLVVRNMEEALSICGDLQTSL